MKEGIILIGGGQHCRVVLYNMMMQGKYSAKCVIDPDINKIGSTIDDCFVEGYEVFDVKYLHFIQQKYNTRKFFISLGSMKKRKKIFEFMIENNWEPVNIIHPNAVVSSSVKIGQGVLIEAGCLITPNPIIGDNVVINTGSQVNHDNIVENHTYIASGVLLSGGVTIKENTLIDDGVIVTLGKSVGKNCIIGAGSVVTKDIPDNSIGYGSPCKVIRENT